MKTKVYLPPIFNWKWVAAVVTLLVLTGNIFCQLVLPAPLTLTKKYMFSLSRGDRYFGRLELWRYFVLRSDWTAANSIATSLDPVDTAAYLARFSPDLIKVNLNRLIFKSGKTADDYLEIARSYTRLGDYDQARQAIKEAHEIDPIRDDVSKLYYQLIK